MRTLFALLIALCCCSCTQYPRLAPVSISSSNINAECQVTLLADAGALRYDALHGDYRGSPTLPSMDVTLSIGQNTYSFKIGIAPVKDTFKNWDAIVNAPVRESIRTGCGDQHFYLTVDGEKYDLGSLTIRPYGYLKLERCWSGKYCVSFSM
jgi:hypothetical protein